MTPLVRSNFASRPHLLILDVDGTCIGSDKRMRPSVQSAIREAVAAGLAVAFATGRMYEAIAVWVRDLGLRTPQICNNGAVEAIRAVILPRLASPGS